MSLIMRQVPKMQIFWLYITVYVRLLLPLAHWDSDVGKIGLSEAEPENIAFSEWARSLDQFIIPDNYTEINVLQFLFF